MQAIINGKRYDTEKAVLIYETSSNHGRGDFSRWDAGLYKTKRSGAYFLAGSGGAMTRFAQRVENGSTGGSKIIPMSEQEAYEWAEQHASTDAVEQHFQHMIEDA